MNLSLSELEVKTAIIFWLKSRFEGIDAIEPKHVSFSHGNASVVDMGPGGEALSPRRTEEQPT